MLQTFWTMFILLLIGFFCTINCEGSINTIGNQNLNRDFRIENTFIDSRDREEYKIVTIGAQIWMAENLRYNCEGSMVNPESPNKSYGRLYDITSAQTACPQGWHMPSDREWDELEMAHGMPFTFIDQGGWRGEHANSLKSILHWEEDGNGTNLLGFNVLPAGYYFGEQQGELQGIDGLGFSAAFWSATKGGVGYARFMFSSRLFVNKWADTNNDSGAALSCRCLKD